MGRFVDDAVTRDELSVLRGVNVIWVALMVGVGVIVVCVVLGSMPHYVSAILNIY